MKKHASELPDFADLLKAAAESRRTRAAIIEKDYYLTRALCALTRSHGGQFALKGGTSLSKGWQLLQRFSEDIDLLLKGDFASGKGARHTRLRECAASIERTDGFRLSRVADSEKGVHRTVIFEYHSVVSDLPGLGKMVVLEAGYRGNPTGSVMRKVRSMVAEFALEHGHSGEATDLNSFEIEAQSLQRTFVEKLFAAHAAYKENFAANGKARHYYDLYEMCKLEDVKRFVGTDQYRQCVTAVREFSEKAFPGQAVPKSGSFATSPAFQPDADGLKQLDGNYKADADLFFGIQPSISDVLKTIGELLPKL